ncbi:MAG: dehydrogenase [Alphaproteobacteria bacterium]|nr:MAG: dehydrogenase [Alphaproteobacteria bacterium]
MTDRVDCVVVGAGVVGLAIARAMAMRGAEVILLERNATIGTETSARNSGVIHAGIYYPTGSLKAKLCVAGKERLYAYCVEHGVPHDRMGKLIVATSEDQLPALEALAVKAAENGVPDVERLSPEAARKLEPEVACVAALLSPSTGIIDAHALMLAYLGDAEAAGAMLALSSPLVAARVLPNGFEIDVGGGEPSTLACRWLVNSAGLGAQAVARSIVGLDPANVPPGYLCKGSYFALSGRSPFRRLVYPMPELAGIGVHVTLDMAGQARFGPDVEWIDEVDYAVDPVRAEPFYAAIRRYWPGLPDGALTPAYAGIRPKLQTPNGPAQDFLIQGPLAHGVPGLVNLFGIESPGLTSSLAIADEVAAMLAA